MYGCNQSYKNVVANRLLWGIHAYAVLVPSPNRYVELVILISLIPNTKYALAALPAPTGSWPKILAILLLWNVQICRGHFIGGTSRIGFNHFFCWYLYLPCDLLYYFINVPTKTFEI